MDVNKNESSNTTNTFFYKIRKGIGFLLLDDVDGWAPINIDKAFHISFSIGLCLFVLEMLSIFLFDAFNDDLNSILSNFYISIPNININKIITISELFILMIWLIFLKDFGMSKNVVNYIIYIIIIVLLFKTLGISLLEIISGEILNIFLRNLIT